MSIITEDIKACGSDSALDAILSGQFYPAPPNGLRKGGTLPTITFLRVSTEPSQTCNGTAELNKSRFQFNLYARSTVEADAMFIALRNALKAELPWVHFIGQLRDLGNPETSTLYLSLDVLIYHEIPVTA